VSLLPAAGTGAGRAGREGRGRVSPIVVAGMHRSGTSFLTSVLHAAGLAVGERLLTPDARNPRGYFEDRDFYDLHLRMLHALTPAGEAGFRDWGWTESERLDRDRLPEFRAAALQLVERRRRADAGAWGWKDPRNALLLDFWHEVLTAAGTTPGYLLVYRSPWDVADAVQRLGVDVFLEHPEYAYRIWCFYNRQLLEFYRRNRQRSLLVAIGAILADPGSFTALLAEKLQLEVPANLPARLFAADGLSTRAADDPLIALVAAASPEAVALLGELDRDADLSAAGLWRRPGPLRPPPVQEPPVVSVVVPCRDQPELLVESLASAERHAPGCELIVVDAGSRQPRAVALLDNLRRAGYQVVEQAAGGGAAARNAGLASARGRYALTLEAGDRLRGGFLEAAVGLLDGEPGVGLVYAGGRGPGTGQWPTPEDPELDLDRLLAGGVIASGALVRLAAWQASGGYDEHFEEDEAAEWDLWIALAERGWQLRRLPGAALDLRPRPAATARAERSAIGERRDRRERLPGAVVQEAVVRKHREIYLRRLPHVLAALERARAALAADAEQLGEERRRLAEERRRVDEERRQVDEQPRQVDEARPRPAAEDGDPTERDRLYQELAAWRERVRVMEATRAWKLRGRLLRLRRLLRSRLPG